MACKPRIIPSYPKVAVELEVIRGLVENLLMYSKKLAFWIVNLLLLVYIAQPSSAPLSDLANHIVQLRAHFGQAIFNMRWNGANLNPPDQAFFFQHLEPA